MVQKEDTWSTPVVVSESGRDLCSYFLMGPWLFKIFFFTLQVKHFVDINFLLREDLWIPQAGKPTHELQLLALFHYDWSSVHEAKHNLGPSLKLPLTHIKLYLSPGSWFFSKPKKAEFCVGSKLGTGWLLMQQHQSALAATAAAAQQHCWYREPE